VVIVSSKYIYFLSRTAVKGKILAREDMSVQSNIEALSEIRVINTTQGCRIIYLAAVTVQLLTVLQTL